MNLSKRNELSAEKLKHLKGGGTCYCTCGCTHSTPASDHNSSDHSKGDVTDSAHLEIAIR